MMAFSGGFQLFFVSVVSVLSAAAFLAFATARADRRRASIRSLIAGAENEIVFLFDDVDLVDATPAASSLLRRKSPDQTDWDCFLDLFGPHFPHLRNQLSNLANDGVKKITSPDNPAVQIVAEHWDGMARLNFSDTSFEHRNAVNDLVTLVSLEEEANSLRGLAEDTPQLIWRQDEDGAITWANKAYLTAAEELSAAGAAAAPTWPPAILFEEIDLPSKHDDRLVRRVPIYGQKQTAPHWYEVTSVLRGKDVIHFATDADAVVRAEETQKDFIQTLGKTFAQLSIGLAIFDRDRRLITFNPALLDLTGLPIEFLSSRPLIHTLLDQLREAQMLPEPKNYSSWREEISALEAAAKAGSYCELWNLPNGLTYRVTGRPHPNGATAFLFEDISAEVSLTQRFRSELEMNQSVFDSVQEAIAVFSSTGALRMCNRAYRSLWHKSAWDNLSETSILEESRSWQEESAPTGLWADIREFVGCFGGRDPWERDFVLADGRRQVCAVSALADGATLVRFRQGPGIARPQALPGRAEIGAQSYQRF